MPSGETKQCPFRSGECWECVKVYHEMVPRLATGATYHAMNNCLMDFVAACMDGNRERYEAARARFLALAKVGAVSSYPKSMR